MMIPHVTVFSLIKQQLLNIEILIIGGDDHVDQIQRGSTIPSSIECKRGQRLNKTTFYESWLPKMHEI